MVRKTSKETAKVTRKAPAGQVAAKTAQPRKEVAKSPAGRPAKAAAKKIPAPKAAGKGGLTAAAGGKAPVGGAKPRLLAGGNPQIAKGDGDGPLQAYLAAIPGWKGDAARRLDALIVRTVPGVRKAIRWNSPFYGIEGRGWFLSFHCITKYIKVGFFRGTSLRPVPPVESKHPEVRYFHIYENEQPDEKLVADWIRQASELPGTDCF